MDTLALSLPKPTRELWVAKPTKKFWVTKPRKELLVCSCVSHRHIHRCFWVVTTCSRHMRDWKLNAKSTKNSKEGFVLKESGSPLNEIGDAPSLSDIVVAQDTEELVGVGSGGGGRVAFLVKKLYRKVLKILSSLSLAIGELFVIAGVLAIGTFIEQGQSPQYYFEKYPEENPALGFLTWRWILGLCLDHLYSSPYFLGLCLLLAASLIACTTTTQLPRAKIAKRWSFMKSESAILKLDVAEALPRAQIKDLGILLMGAGYEVFLSDSKLYGFKGLAGRVAPIGVHVALLCIMLGGTTSAVGSFRGTVTVPQGLNFMIGDALNPSGYFSIPIPAFSKEVHVEKFYMDYYENGRVSQFHSDLFVRDLYGKELFRKTISVNDPLRYEGVTIYQTDWGISAIQVHRNGEGPFNLPVATLQDGTNKLFGAFIPLEDGGSSEKPKGISLLARDLQSVTFYDRDGNFAGVRRPGSNRPITINGVTIVVDESIGSTGLELKVDPGVPLVYAGFGLLMLTTVVSFFPHSQVWALQKDMAVYVGGKSSKWKERFESEINELLDLVPEILTSSSDKRSKPIEEFDDDHRKRVKEAKLNPYKQAKKSVK